MKINNKSINLTTWILCFNMTPSINFLFRKVTFLSNKNRNNLFNIIMSILSKDEIVKAIKEGEIKITPFDENNIGCASIDLTLSNEFRYYKPGLHIVEVNEEVNYKDITEKIVLSDNEPYLLLPGQACLGITKERITLSNKLCGLLEGRSRFARLGLFVHITAGFMNPGIDNRQVLEIYNASNHPLQLRPGTKMCQFIFMRMVGESKYSGIFNKQDL
jgi:dCTP deaminase